MNEYELQILEGDRYCDETMRAAKDIEVLPSLVHGSRLHDVIHNPIDSATDEN